MLPWLSPTAPHHPLAGQLTAVSAVSLDSDPTRKLTTAGWPGAAGAAVAAPEASAVGTSIAKRTPEIVNNVDSNEAGSRFHRLAIATALQPNPALTPKPTSLTVEREPPPLSSLSRIG